jgi:hypothetical protein
MVEEVVRIDGYDRSFVKLKSTSRPACGVGGEVFVKGSGRGLGM